MKMYLLPVLAFSVAICAAADGASDKPLTLHECISEALGRSPRLESGRYTLAADKEAIKKEQAGLLPNLTAGAELQNLTGSPVGPFSVLNVNNPDVTGLRANSKRGPNRVSLASVGNGTLRMRYPLYEQGSIFGLNNAPAVAATKSVYIRQQWTMRLSEQLVVETLAGTFYNATAYQQKAALDGEKVELSKKRLVIMKQELALDLTLPQYVELAKAELAADEQTLATSQQRAQDSMVQLAQLIGRPLHQKFKLDLTEPRIPALPPLEDFLKRVALQHPAVGIQQANIDVAQQNLRLAQAALLPNVNFVTEYTGATAFGAQNPDLLYMVLRVEVPVFDFGHGLAAEREERDKLKAAQAELGQVYLDLRESILTELSDIHTTESTIAGLERDCIQTKNSADLIREEHELGAATELALVDAEEAFTKAKDALTLARLVQRLEYVRLQRLAGGVWVWNR
jgi:outer membrane protein TolC